jgi:hypothetical protein
MYYLYMRECKYEHGIWTGLRPKCWEVKANDSVELSSFEKLTVVQLVKKFLVFNWNTECIAVFTRVRHWILLYTWPIQFTSSYPSWETFPPTPRFLTELLLYQELLNQDDLGMQNACRNALILVEKRGEVTQKQARVRRQYWYVSQDLLLDILRRYINI